MRRIGRRNEAGARGVMSCCFSLSRRRSLSFWPGLSDAGLKLSPKKVYRFFGIGSQRALNEAG